MRGEEEVDTVARMPNSMTSRRWWSALLFVTLSVVMVGAMMRMRGPARATAATEPFQALGEPKQELPAANGKWLRLTTNLSGAANLLSAYPDVAVLVLTTVIDDQLVLDAIHNGARGYVVKEVDTSELVRAIRAVSQGDSAFDSRSAAAMVRGINAAPLAESRQLTRREREVLKLLARGLSNRAIGRQLYISETTAKFHVGNIIRKLQVTRRAEAVYVASKEGVI